jgi:hypothetical protein
MDTGVAEFCPRKFETHKNHTRPESSALAISALTASITSSKVLFLDRFFNVESASDDGAENELRFYFSG